MKKLVLIIFAIVFTLSVTGFALAGRPKAPKSMCLTVPPTAVVFSIVTKPGGSMKINGNQSVKFYDIQGIFSEGPASAPLDGSGYMDGDVFRFHLTGVLSAGSNATTITAEVYYDVIQESGTMNIMFATVGSVGLRTWPLEAMPCTDVTIP